MAGKWHLGINEHDQDRHFTPLSHGYESYLGAPWTNAPMCAMDSEGYSRAISTGPDYCFLFANDTVVEQPLAVENFTRTITNFATDWIHGQDGEQPWFFFMSYFHVHTPLFTQRANRGRSRGGEFGDNVEELDDSIGMLLETIRVRGFANTTLSFLTSDNGPYQEEGWAHAGRTNLYDDSGALIGRLRGGKGQVFEGGVRMPGAVLWPGVTPAGAVSDTLVSTMDIFPTVLAAAGVMLPPTYVVDGKDMTPILRNPATAMTAHDVFLHYCGFRIIAARVLGRWKVFWATQSWYTNDPADSSICTECCNGVNSAGTAFAGVNATQLCGCGDKDLESHEAQPIVFDLQEDLVELRPLTKASWPTSAPMSYDSVVQAAAAARSAMEAQVHPKPSITGAGTCTAGLPSPARQPCCSGCHKKLFGKSCVDEETGDTCTCELL